jgi:mono/diheme cytochrome c family protein
VETIYKIFSMRGRALWSVLAITLFVAMCGRMMADDTPGSWVAPDDAKASKNPVPSTHDNLENGERLYRENCTICHGDKGHGDGIGIKMLTVKPSDLTDPKRMAQETDGSLFWKITAGRSPMPAWKDTLTETERWTLVNYLHKLEIDASGTDKGSN